MIAISYRLPVGIGSPDALWPLLWQRVVAPQTCLASIEACEIVDTRPGACRRRVVVAGLTVEEDVRYEPGQWVQFRSRTADGQSGLLTISLEENEVGKTALRFDYRLARRDERMPDGSRLSQWLEAAYRAQDEAFVGWVRERVAPAARS